jgi:HK97 family phage portal protein
MSFFSRMAAPAQRASGGTPSYGMIPPLGSVQSASGALISQATAMTDPAVYACVNRLATDLARCSPGLYRFEDDGSKKRDTKHPLNALFVRPNRQQTWFEFDRQMWTGYLLRGNAYAAIRRDRRGNPIELIPINPDAVIVLETGEGDIFYNVNRIGLWQIAMLRDFPIAIPSEDIFHLRDVTFNSLVGASNIGLARDSIGLSMALSQQASRWIGNGARPAMLLEAQKRLGDDVLRRLKRQFDDMHAGYQNTGKTVVLEDGITAKEMQLTSVDLEFIQQRQMQPEEICRFFGVPPHKIGIGSASRGSTQNLAAQDQDYVNSAITQRVVCFEQRFAWTFGLDAEDLLVERDLSQLLRADVMTRANVSRINILSGKTTQNEERQDDGRRPLPGGDRLMMPTNMAAEGSNITGQAPDGAGRPIDGTVGAGDSGTGGTQATGQGAAAETGQN